MSPSLETDMVIRAESGPKGSKEQAAELNASLLSYIYNTAPQPVPREATANAADESVCTDHMITAQWKESTGWAAPELKPYGPLSIMPTASCLHYATECFEGLKVYRGFDGKLRVFRLDRNAARFQMSAQRMSLPGFNLEEFQKLVLALLAVDGAKWLPKDRAGSFLYVRPTMIGTYPQLGVQAPKQAMMFIVVSFMPRLDNPEGGLRLFTSLEKDVRAWIGGFGHTKVGANYGPTVLATKHASSLGYKQILWLYGENGEVTEAGGSNFFVVWKRKDGKKELVTGPLGDQLILDGVVRRSCLELVKERLGDDLEITERKYTISEVMEAYTEGRLLEAFVSGTAVSLWDFRMGRNCANGREQWFITAVSHIHHRGEDIPLSMGTNGLGGEVTLKVKEWLRDMLYGNVDHEWTEVVHETGPKQ